MKKPLYHILTMALLTLALTAGPALASRIDADLERILAATGSGEKVGVLVQLNERLNTEALKAELLTSGASRAERHIAVVEELRAASKTTQARILGYLWFQKLFGQVDEYRSFWIDNIIALEGSPRVIRRLAARPDVHRIAYDYPLELIEPVDASPATAAGRGVENGVAVSRAPELWALGIDGTGALACHLDTGVDGDHPALISNWRGLDPGVTTAEAWFDPVTNTTFPFDSGSHGTHTMGTICGSEGTNQIGMAPGAKWISAGVIDRAGISQTVTDAIAAFEWAADPDGDPGTSEDVPDVVSNSWGLVPVSHGYPDCDPLFNAVIDNVEVAGAVVVFAAGNEGSSGLRIPADRITSPVNTFSVGALNQDATSIASFSSRGPSDCDNTTIKPEVCAVGSNVRSSVPGTGYSTMSGTSMACPHVAGAVLLLRQVKPEATVDEIKYALYLTAVDLGSAGEDNTFGMGSIDLVEAANALENGFGTIDGHVTEAGTDAPIEGAVVSLSGTGFYGMSDDTGFYSLLATAETTYQVDAMAFGYQGDSDSLYLPVDTTVSADFSLDPAENGTLQGTVVQESNGDALEGVTISFLNAPVSSIETDNDGFYQITLPGAFAYDIGASKSRYDAANAYDIVVPEGGTAVQDFELDRDTCFFKAAAAGSAAEADLDTFREARMLFAKGGPFGTKILRLYQEHTAEVAMILLADSELRAEVRSMISRSAPVVRSIVLGENLSHPVFTRHDEAAVNALLDGLALNASPQLRTSIESVRSDIRTFRQMKIGQIRTLVR